MSKEWLKRFRLIIPGIIIMLFILLGLTKTKDELMDISLLFSRFNWSDLYYIFYIGVIIILGALYYALNIRWLVWKHYNKKVEDNIKDTILNECTLNISAKQWYNLKKENAVMIIFYDFIDNNESLKDRSNDVRFNGLIWTTCFDITILSCLAGFIYTILFFTTTRSHYIYISLFSFWLCFIALAFSSLLTYRHLAKSNDQLEVIKQKYKEDINTKISEAINNLKL